MIQRRSYRSNIFIDNQETPTSLENHNLSFNDCQLHPQILSQKSINLINYSNQSNSVKLNKFNPFQKFKTSINNDQKNNNSNSLINSSKKNDPNKSNIDKKYIDTYEENIKEKNNGKSFSIIENQILNENIVEEIPLNKQLCNIQNNRFNVLIIKVIIKIIHPNFQSTANQNYSISQSKNNVKMNKKRIKIFDYPDEKLKGEATKMKYKEFNFPNIYNHDISNVYLILGKYIL